MSTTIVTQRTEINQFIFGQPLSDSDNASFLKVIKARPELSPLVIARFLKSCFTIEASFYRAIHRAMYSSIDLSAPNPILQSLSDVASFCVSNNKVLNIITYNYDDLCERSMPSTIEGRYDVITDELSYREAGNPIKIFHVHGYVPLENATLSNRANIILAEDQYHELYTMPYRWANHIQVGMFGYSTCLFIGFSLTDPNVRRIIDAINLSRSTPHYCILRRTTQIGEMSKTDVKFNDIMTGLALRDLGVSVLYIDQYDEIASILTQLIPQG
jgi:SIR2-like domain